MNVNIFSNAFGHFLESTLSHVILGQDNGNVVQCHPRGLQDDNTRGVGRVKVKQGGHMLSKSRLTCQVEKKHGHLGEVA
jgi:hypothetical protein